MDTTLLLYLDEKWQRVDLYEDISINVVIQELAVNNLQSRKSPYSKQFVVPATSANSNLFEHYFEVNGTDFNPLIKIPCSVDFRGTNIFVGVCRLNAVINYPNYTDFELYIISEIGDFISELSNTTLQDLDWTEYQHEQNYDNITLSWEAKNDDTTGLFEGDILYPIINYGLEYTGTGTGATPIFTYTFGETYSFDNPSYAVPERFFKPAIRAKAILEKIFANTNYEVQSEFFETDYFNSIYIDLFTNGQLGIPAPEDVENQNIFKAASTEKTLTYNGGVFKPFPFSTRFGGTYDPLNNFNSLGSGSFRAPYTGQYFFNVRFEYESLDFVQDRGSFNVVAFSNTGALLYISPTYQVGYRSFVKQQAEINLFFDVAMTVGQTITLLIQENLPYSSLPLTVNTNPGRYIIKPYKGITINENLLIWELYSSPTITEGTVDIALGLPNISSSDFLKGLITMFNLVVVEEGTPNIVKIEPYNWYFNEDDRAEKDWTNILDLNSNYRVEPLSFELPKEINFTYASGDEEYLNKIFEQEKDYVFGRYKFISSANLLSGVSDYESPFAALPTTVVNGSDDFIMPAVYRELENQLQPYSSKPHIFFWTGNRWCYEDQNKQIPLSWYMLSGVTAVEQSTYPCVSHLSSLDVQIPFLISDLNFGPSFDFFGNYNTYINQYTPYDLYNNFWQNYVEDTYSLETRRLSGKFFLKPLDIYDTSLTDKIWVKDSFYRIEKITDADLMFPKLTDVSLIKERSGYYRTDLVAPYNVLSGNTPHPGPLSAYTANTYTATTISPVCDETANIGNVTTFGITGFTNYQEVWYDKGAVMAPLPLGTYLKPVGDTTTYVVIDKSGRILEQEC